MWCLTSLPLFLILSEDASQIFDIQNCVVTNFIMYRKFMARLEQGFTIFKTVC